MTTVCISVSGMWRIADYERETIVRIINNMSKMLAKYRRRLQRRNRRERVDEIMDMLTRLAVSNDDVEMTARRRRRNGVIVHARCGRWEARFRIDLDKLEVSEYVVYSQVTQ